MVLTLHLGAHKTATTHLQESLRLAICPLRDVGVHYLGPRDLRENLLPLIRSLNDSGRVAQRQRTRRRMRTAFDVYPEILLSDENIIGGTKRHRLFGPNGQIYPDAGPRLRLLTRLLGNRPVVAALSVRDPARFHMSAFSLQVSQGFELDPDQYMSGRDPAAVDWTGLARRILAVPGVTRLIMWRYEDYRSLRPRILDALLPAGLSAQVPDPRPANVGISQPAYDWLVARAMKDSDTDLRILVRRARSRFPRQDGHPALDMLCADDYERSARNYALDVDRLRGLPGVELLEP